jgi:hypothetical protein
MNAGRYADSGSTSGSASDYPQYHREDALRLQALSSRTRFRDEPNWGGRQQRYDPRNSRSDHDDRDSMDRERLHDGDLDTDRDDPFRESRYSRPKPTWLVPRGPRHEDKPVEELPPCLFPSPNPRLVPWGPDGHPQATRTLAPHRRRVFCPCARCQLRRRRRRTAGASRLEASTRQESRGASDYARTRRAPGYLALPLDRKLTPGSECHRVDGPG